MAPYSYPAALAGPFSGHGVAFSPDGRLLAALTTRPLPRWLIIHWDAWTRRHQARARWFHKRARLARNAEPFLVS